MKYIDVFNGDADGIFSLIQLRKYTPISADDEQLLITGVKRDIKLLSKISDDTAKAAKVQVLDISFDKNTADVNRILTQCDSLFYCDHHKADNLFEHPKLTTRINTEPTVCTGLLINAQLGDKFPLWAIAAAFGDGLDHIAHRHVERLGLAQAQAAQLKELGVLVNYNGYGSDVVDLHFAPADLYQQLLQYDTPFDVIEDTQSPFATLKDGYEADIEKAHHSHRLAQPEVLAVVLDDAAWARRISGTFGNQLAANNPDKPVVVVTHNKQGSYTISLRAPKNTPYGASSICSQFATGGGREGAAGVNELPVNQLDNFIATVIQHYQAV